LLTWYREHGLIRLESFVASAIEFPKVWEYCVIDWFVFLFGGLAISCSCLKCVNCNWIPSIIANRNLGALVLFI